MRSSWARNIGLFAGVCMAGQMGYSQAQRATALHVVITQHGIEVRPTTFTVRANQSLPNVLVYANTAYRLPIRVDDPSGFLAAAKAKTADVAVEIGVRRGTEPLVYAKMMKEDAKGQDHSALVPYDSPVAVYVRSGAFELEDDRGRPHLVQRTILPLEVGRSEKESPLHSALNGRSPNGSRSTRRRDAAQTGSCHLRSGIPIRQETTS